MCKSRKRGHPPDCWTFTPNGCRIEMSCLPEQRNANTAKVYDGLGLAEYAAIESFVRWDGRPLD